LNDDVVLLHCMSPLLADVVEKSSPFGWHCALGRFDPAELSRLLGFCGRWIGGDFDADTTT
jgi:hypothetical protein